MTTGNDTPAEKAPTETPTAATAVERAKARGHAVPEPPATVVGEQHRRPGHWSETGRYDHPEHYDLGAFQVSHVVEAWLERTAVRPAAAWHVGVALRYLLRSGRKKGDDPAKHVADLTKARWHVSRAITVIYEALYDGDYR